MKIWVDAQLSPVIATWLSAAFGVDAKPVRELGLRDAEDSEIFKAAAAADAVVLTKDKDFFPSLTNLRLPTASDLAHLRQYVECRSHRVAHKYI
jgi:predicted nuclease of predicted toxin-antitoxin system